MHPPGILFSKQDILKLTMRTFGQAPRSYAHICGEGFLLLWHICLVCYDFPSYVWPTNYGQYLPYFLWTSLSRLLPCSGLWLIYEFLEIPRSYEPLDLVFEGHTHVSVVPYISVKGTILLTSLLDLSPFVASSYLYRFLSSLHRYDPLGL